MQPDSTLLLRFPKQRLELPEAYRKIYAEHYKRNREGRSPASSLSQKMESWMHHKVAEDLARAPRECSTLEIGAGNLNHLQYEPPSEQYDVVEALGDLVAVSSNRFRVRNDFRGLAEIGDRHYDRIISIAAFEHYCDLPDVVQSCASLLAPGGQLRVAVPSEGSLLWRLGWELTTGLEFRWKYGLDYGVLMKHEHVNTAAEIEAVLRLCFSTVRRSVFGIRPRFSFYQFFECRKDQAVVSPL
jgi:SAM-dependent methyltransferase